jgi:large subunit ribosomal protein L10
MARAEKVTAVEEIAEKLDRAKGVYVTDFQGMTVRSVSELRVRLRNAGVEYKVVKNTLLKRALAGRKIEGLDRYLEGPTALALSYEDEIRAAKLLTDFQKEFERPAMKAALVDGRVYAAEDVKRLAALPGKDAILARLAMTLEAPVRKLHATLSSPLSKLAAALHALAEEKEKRSAGPAAEAEGGPTSTGAGAP